MATSTETWQAKQRTVTPPIQTTSDSRAKLEVTMHAAASAAAAGISWLLCATIAMRSVQQLQNDTRKFGCETSVVSDKHW